jgi:uncharacterized membrane protein YphA (DoxX/SURF4 family)
MTLMDVVLWVVSALLAVVFLAAGSMKAVQPRERILRNPQLAWAEDFSDRAITVIGVLEVLGAAGLVLPWALDVAPVLTPLAAVGLALVMAGAIVTHARRGERQALPVTVFLLVLALVVALGRFAQL